MSKSRRVPRYDQRAILSFDGGSYSVKYTSDDTRGSFVSVAAGVAYDTLAGFNQLTDVNSYDLDIINNARVQGRWIVGQQAEGRQNMQRYTRNMRRFDDSLFIVFMCAALRAAFPERYRNLKELDERRGVIDGRWRVPVHAVVSIAPGYYANSDDLAEATKGYYDFVDLRKKRLYTFTVENVTVVPEGWGIYATRLYKEESGQIIKRKVRSFVESTTAIIDIGGRTTDIMAWQRGRPIEYTVASNDMGIILTANKIIDDIMAAHHRDMPNKPTLDQVIHAIEKGKNARLIAAGGRQIDVSEIIIRNMNQLAADTWELYQNKLMGGQGINTILYGAGGSYLARPYIHKQFVHSHELVAARTLEGMFMANSVGSYLYAKHKYMERENG